MRRQKSASRKWVIFSKNGQKSTKISRIFGEISPRNFFPGEFPGNFPEIFPEISSNFNEKKNKISAVTLVHGHKKPRSRGWFLTKIPGGISRKFPEILPKIVLNLQEKKNKNNAVTLVCDHKKPGW